MIVGGGYGLYLKQIHLQEIGERTLVPGEFGPAPRATQDIDFLLRTEIVADTTAIERLRAVLDGLGYIPNAEGKYMQFIKPLSHGRNMKVDFLTGPIPESYRSSIHVKGIRARPTASAKSNKPAVQLHAYVTDEALGLAEGLLSLEVSGTRTHGSRFTATIYLPNPFTYLLMKLFAFRDREKTQDKLLAQHHALDIYRIVAMLTEQELAFVTDSSQRYQHDPMVQEAKQIIADGFASTEAVGILRLREYVRQSSAIDIPSFVREIRSILQ